MSERVRIWCLRHAEAEHGTSGTGGTMPTAPLTTRGRQQAIAAAQTLAAEPITRIYASTALRARQTAELLATMLATTSSLPITAMPELVEAGCTADVLRAWVIEQDLGRRGADGETGQQVVARVTAALQQIASAHPGETVAVVGHVASLTVALGRCCGLGVGVWGRPLLHAQPFLVEWDGHAWHCPTWPAGSPVHTPLDYCRTTYPIRRSLQLPSWPSRATGSVNVRPITCGSAGYPDTRISVAGSWTVERRVR